jgi:DhnA family fructose-bisphosphate aldolase class Ia
MHQGKENRQGSSGIWENPQWGSYTLCVYASSDKAIRITTDADCYVVNLASEAETEQLYQLIQDKMPASR